MIVFEDKALADEAVVAVEQEIQHDVEHGGFEKHAVVHEERRDDEISNGSSGGKV